MTRSPLLSACVLLASVIAAMPAAHARQSNAADGGMGKKGEEDKGEKKGEEVEFPAPLDAFFEALNPARIQRAIDEARGRDTERTDKPAVAEFPLAVFVESVRPLGALKYENQFNFLTANFSGDAPSLETATFEYVFADWNSARFELIAPAGKLDALGFGYQRTVDVGTNGNWAHGFLILPEVAVHGRGFVGGSVFYTGVWKPERESPWTYSASAGINRASFANRPLAGTNGGGLGSMSGRMMGGGDASAGSGEDDSRVYRPFGALNAWYTFTPQFTVGLEADAYVHDRFGEYLIQPNLTWRPVKHFFVQFGAGYYETSGRGQASFMCRVNLLNPSARKPAAESSGP